MSRRVTPAGCRRAVPDHRHRRPEAARRRRPPPTARGRPRGRATTLRCGPSRSPASGTTDPAAAAPATAGPSGRERHDEKITVYCSPDELIDLEQARLTLRGDHGMAVDRGRIVREALARRAGRARGQGRLEQGHRVPGRRGHAARPQGGSAAAVGRRRGRRGPGPARGSGHPVRPSAAVPRLPRGGCAGSPHGSHRGQAVPRVPWDWKRASPRLLPEVLLGLGAAEFALLAARAMAPRPGPRASIDHAPARLARQRARAGDLAGGAAAAGAFDDLPSAHRRLPDTLHVVARFLALLELFRESAVAFDQVDALGELHVRWTGSDEGELSVDGRVRRHELRRDRRRRRRDHRPGESAPGAERGLASVRRPGQRSTSTRGPTTAGRTDEEDG